MTPRTAGQRRRGAAIVETALVLPAAIVFILMILIGGLGVFRYNELALLAREGARYASVHGKQYEKETGNSAATAQDIYDNAIEFINARRNSGFVPPASPAIRYGITQRLNPQIAAIFGRREYGAGVPRGGLPMVLKQSSIFSGRRAEVFTANDEFRLKIYGA